MYTGELVKLRAYKKEDIERNTEFINNPDIRQSLFPTMPFPATVQEQEKWFGEISSRNNHYDFAIECLETGEFIGGCGIHRISWKNRHLDLSVFIGDKKFWGNGYGTDTMKVLVRFAFDQLNMNKVKLNVFSSNKGAIKCYEKSGFKVEGVLRDEIYANGVYCDDIAMGMLRTEYEELYQ